MALPTVEGEEGAQVGAKIALEPTGQRGQGDMVGYDGVGLLRGR